MADAHARLREKMALAACRYFREKVRGEPAGMACECMVDGDGACIQWLGLADTQIALIAASEDARALAGLAIWQSKRAEQASTADFLAATALSALAPKDTGNG